MQQIKTREAASATTQMRWLQAPACARGPGPGFNGRTPTGVMELIMDSNFLNCASAWAICLSVIAAMPTGSHDC